MAKYEPKGIVWGKKKESAWPAVIGVVGFLVLLAVFG